MWSVWKEPQVEAKMLYRECYHINVAPIFAVGALLAKVGKRRWLRLSCGVIREDMDDLGEHEFPEVGNVF